MAVENKLRFNDKLYIHLYTTSLDPHCRKKSSLVKMVIWFYDMFSFSFMIDFIW